MKKLKILKSSPDSITYQSESGTTLKAAPNEMLQKNILLLFDGKDRARIRELASAYIPPKMEYDLFWLGGLFALYLSFLLLAIPMSPNAVHVLSTFQPAGILIFPLTFIILDSVNEIFQYRYARMLTFVAAAIMVIASALVYLTTHVFDMAPAYQEVFTKLPKLYLINALCLLVADQTNNLVFRTIRYRLAVAPLWFRCIVSTTIGQISYTIIWIGLFFGTSASTDLFVKIINNYGFKVIYAACLIPVTYMIVATYRSRKQQPQQEIAS
ncbi:VUT family protein [Vibrio mangrovi]|uniref:VUT family protein n=1 Tax=Vibrio mangrovi TaxID=474394 RepID=A0A1Y6J0Y1_9VIBR|nr:VUT family protein [Vibrio mangrovi]MDW6002516.1 VUT family protein [Vibrio mangrovi]SMS01953.1 hypothetical protein VIM7927_03264 [Vibrio mangrovi]